MRKSLTTYILTITLLSSLTDASEESFSPPQMIKLQPLPTKYAQTSNYESIKIKGIEILLSPKVTLNKQLKAKTIKRLSVQIASAQRLLPIAKLKALKPIRIWVEFNARESGYAEYHAYQDWLQENDYNPEKYKGIEITNIANYLKWSSRDPLISSVLIHEIAHAYYHALNQDDKNKVQTAYNNVKKQNLYRNVYRLGTSQHGVPIIIDKAWALEDEWEYFSELTEAVFAKNDYFPHTSKELEKYDPNGYIVVKSLWNKIAMIKNNEES